MSWFHDFEQRRFTVILALWGRDGLVEKMFKPIELWQAQCAGSVAGECMPAGHFIPEQLHLETAQALRAFFK
jgi:haloacetate dehalogenase